jgi:hypothetical protein
MHSKDCACPVDACKIHVATPLTLICLWNLFACHGEREETRQDSGQGQMQSLGPSLGYGEPSIAQANGIFHIYNAQALQEAPHLRRIVVV